MQPKYTSTQKREPACPNNKNKAPATHKPQVTNIDMKRTSIHKKPSWHKDILPRSQYL